MPSPVGWLTNSPFKETDLLSSNSDLSAFSGQLIGNCPESVIHPERNSRGDCGAEEAVISAKCRRLHCLFRGFHKQTHDCGARVHLPWSRWRTNLPGRSHPNALMLVVPVGAFKTKA